jgi:hypothetical protein
MTYKYDHVEDYIEIIAGARKPSGERTNIFNFTPSPINLARYDVNMLESLSHQSTNSVGYTDRQAPLALAIALKYERQLNKLGVDVEPLKVTPKYRLPLRNIDRSTKLWIEDDKIYLRFPYSTALIESIRSAAKEIDGSLRFNKDRKVWVAGLTESALNWLHTFAVAHEFAIDPAVTDLIAKILEVEQTPFAIELQADSMATTLNITNAESSLIDYVNEHLGGFSSDNLLTLVDNSPLLGYTVNSVIEDVVIGAYGPRFWSLCANRELKAESHNAEALFKDIMQYAEATNRFPVYVYEPDKSDNLLLLAKQYGPVTELDRLRNYIPTAEMDRIVYVTNVPKNYVGRLPLMISSAGMLFGGDRAVWVQNSEKIVYFTNEVYAKGSTGGKTLCKLD